ncbi:MAG: tyrosine-type recombinase/integrase [Nanoarchaeota archaeon]|nr:tyrosine-type recombinase/integrase [Nanoarchaeota archaeon]
MVNKLPAVLSKEHLLRVLSVMEDLRMVITVFLGIFLGLRISEIVKLEWDNIDLVYGEAKIKDAKNPYRFRTGYGKDRIVPINEMFLPVLKRWKLISEDKKYVIPRKEHGNKKDDATIKSSQDRFHKYLQKAGIQEIDNYQRDGRPRYKYHLHTLRHVCGTNLYRAGMDIYQIKEYLGHSDIETTQIYCDLAKDDLKAASHKAYAYPKSNIAMEQELIIVPDKEALQLQNENLKMMMQLKEVELYATR